MTERPSGTKPAAERRPSVRHRVEDAALRAVTGLAGALGERHAQRVGESIGRLLFRAGMRRDVALDNLRRAFPERDDAWVHRVARDSFAHFGRELIVTLRLSEMTADELIARSDFTGLDAVRERLALGDGAVIVTGHLGNWEVAAACMAARGLPMAVVAQRQSNPLSDRRINDVRRRFGSTPMDRREAAKKGLRTLRRGGLLAFVADQDARGSGVFVPFFGRMASTHRGPALLALRTGAPLFAAGFIRTADGRYDCHIHPIDENREGEPDEVVHRLTAAYTAVLEQAVRSAPEQYLWQHRRWKTQPPADGIS
jgi:Kdo2-lipid IVA lauroyltransferase/acyltransferase